MCNTNPDIDAATLKRARRNDPQARAAIYRALGPTVFTLARRMLGSSVQAEDVLHETFIEVFTKIRGYRGDSSLAAWVRRIAVNKCLAYWRSSWVARRVDVDVTELPTRQFAPECDAWHARLAKSLDELSPTSRMVVWMHDVEGYTHKEIAEIMGRTASFSKSQLARAHERLREALKQGLDGSETKQWPNELKTY